MTVTHVAAAKSAFPEKAGAGTPTALLESKSMKQSTLGDYNNSDYNEVTCPTCGRADFKNKRGLRQHHARTHNESLRSTTLKCGLCGSDYTVTKDKSDGSRFCSRECKDSAMKTELHPNYTRKQIPCSNCGDPVTTTRKQREEFNAHYCGSGCMYESQTGEAHHNYNSVKTGCVECGAAVERNESHIRELGPFCSHDCYGDYLSRERSGQENPNWRGGSSTTNAVRKLLGEDSWSRMAERARKRAGRECEICGTSPSSKKLDVHHIVPLSAGGTNDSWNLMTLCESCHPTVETYVRQFEAFDSVLTE